MIYKTAKELYPAYFNCLKTSPLAQNILSLKEQGDWWRDTHNVYPQIGGLYGFKTEQDLLLFLLKWT